MSCSWEFLIGCRGILPNLIALEPTSRLSELRLRELLLFGLYFWRRAAFFPLFSLCLIADFQLLHSSGIPAFFSEQKHKLGCLWGFLRVRRSHFATEPALPARSRQNKGDFGFSGLLTVRGALHRSQSLNSDFANGSFLERFELHRDELTRRESVPKGRSPVLTVAALLGGCWQLLRFSASSSNSRSTVWHWLMQYILRCRRGGSAYNSRLPKLAPPC